MVLIYTRVDSQHVSKLLCFPLLEYVAVNLSHFFNKPKNRSFSYTSRKALLDRVAFGISRSTLRQQDTKVNVGRLKQRMTSLRARAVELVGEAFSGGAEDPTALQLQADELYGMEEVRIRFHVSHCFLDRHQAILIRLFSSFRLLLHE